MFYSFCYLTNNFNLKLNIKLLRNIFQLLFSLKSKSKYYYKHTIKYYFIVCFKIVLFYDLANQNYLIYKSFNSFFCVFIFN